MFPASLISAKLNHPNYILSVSAPGLQPETMHLDLSVMSEKGLSIYLKSDDSPKAGRVSSVSAHELLIPQGARDSLAAGQKKLYGDTDANTGLLALQRVVAKAPNFYEASYEMGVAYLTLSLDGQGSNHTSGKANENRVVLPFHCVPQTSIRKLEWLREMLISILILVASLAALIQFAAFTWRAAFLTVATAELPEEHVKLITLNYLEEASAYEKLCPELGVRTSARLGVSAYNSLLQFVKSIGDSILPPAAGWAQREMALCTRYATVTLARRLERNRVVAAELSSF